MDSGIFKRPAPTNKPHKSNVDRNKFMMCTVKVQFVIISHTLCMTPMTPTQRTHHHTGSLVDLRHSVFTFFSV